MSAFAGLIVAFALAAFLRARGHYALRSIMGASVLVPLATAFEVFVYPALDEVQMWWPIIIATTFVYGLIAAALGYGVAAFVQRHRNA